MIFHKDTYKDIVRYYDQTFIKLAESGDRLWRVRHINTEEVELVDVDGFSVWLDLNDEYEVDYPLPGRAVYQCGEHAFFLCRKPAKQYYRGICSSNTSLSYLRSNDSWAPADVTLPRLQQFVDKPCYQNLDNLSPGYQSWALNPVFSVTNKGSLYALHKKVGHIDFVNKAVNMESILKPEFKSLMPTGWEFV
jgi:hypothetical protein